MTKQGMNFYRAWERSQDTQLGHVYKSRPSDAKIKAYNWCREKCHEMGGYGFRIIGHNTFAFTVAWLTCENGRYILWVETAENSYKFDID